MKTHFKLRPVARMLAGRKGKDVLQGCDARHRSRPHELLPLGTMVACLALAPGVSPAQSTTPSQETTLPEVKVRESATSDDYNAPTSTVGGVVPTPIRDIPQSATVINSVLMQSQGATSLADALRNVPGITIGAAEGGSIGNNFNLRGFSARTDLYLDGMRDRGQVYRDVFSLDAVEVLQGPSSMLFGRGSTGGVINQVSKLPSLARFGNVSVTGGTQPSLRTTIDYNQQIDETSAFRIAAMGQYVHSTRDVMKSEDYGFAPSMRFGIGTPTEVTLSGLLTHYDDMPDYGLPPVNGAPAQVNRRNFYGLTDDRTIQEVLNLNAVITHRLTPDVALRNQTQYFVYKVDARESGPNNVGTVSTGGIYTAFPATNLSNGTPLPPWALSVGLGSHDRNIKDTLLFNQTDLIAEFQTGPVRHLLITGLELGRETNRAQNYSRNNPGSSFFGVVSLVDPAYNSGAGLNTLTGNLVNAEATDVAPYVNDTMSFGEYWKVVAGVRYDQYNASLTNSINPPPSASQNIGFTSVRAGVIYQPTEAQSYYVSYGTSFNPSLETLALVNGQQSLDPETSRQYELGGKWDLMGGDLSLTSAIFEIEKTNTRSQISTGVYELTGDVRVRGFQAGAAGRLTRNWQVFGGYTFLDAEIVKASVFEGTQANVPANTPRNAASLWTTYDLTAAWQVGTGFAYMSDRYASNNNAVKVGDYFRWDAMVAYRQPRYDVQLNVLNLTNRLNFDALIPSDKGRSVPGTNLQALLTFTYRFF
ncbi:MAG TPA: TonB-dependent siderophore receptor [Burkholderiales bacterium]|nr:TonB-dependent siderophore receptor [Burkholderiales bacterium]